MCSWWRPQEEAGTASRAKRESDDLDVIWMSRGAGGPSYGDESIGHLRYPVDPADFGKDPAHVGSAHRTGERTAPRVPRPGRCPRPPAPWSGPRPRSRCATRRYRPGHRVGRAGGPFPHDQHRALVSTTLWRRGIPVGSDGMESAGKPSPAFPTIRRPLNGRQVPDGPFPEPRVPCSASGPRSVVRLRP